MSDLYKWILEKGPVAAIGAALLMFVLFHILWTMNGNSYDMFGQSWGANKNSRSDLPAGSIVAFHSTAGRIPSGWVVCDGSNGTPDLRNKFIQGVSSITDSGLDAKATASHKHIGVTKALAQPQVMSTTDGPDNLATTYFNHTHEFETNESTHIPPNYRLVFLMKTAN